MDLFNLLDEEENARTAFKIEITEVPDLNNDGAIDLSDVEELLKSKKNILTKLRGNGDFRSEECIELLKEADVVVTNPPFSLFRQYVAQLMEYNKKFIIIGNQNAITYKEIFPYIKDDKLWLGVSIHSGDREFRIPDNYEVRSKSLRVDEKGNKYIRVVGVRWFTNVDNRDRHEELTLYKNYSPEEFPSFDNYDAINVDKTSDIPDDYYGWIGVPITFLDKYNPEQFEIIGMTKTPIGNHLRSKVYGKQIQHNPNGSTQIVTKANDGAVIRISEPLRDKPYYEIEGKLYKAVYPRILIKRRG